MGERGVGGKERERAFGASGGGQWCGVSRRGVVGGGRRRGVEEGTALYIGVSGRRWVHLPHDGASGFQPARKGLWWATEAPGPRAGQSRRQWRARGPQALKSTKVPATKYSSVLSSAPTACLPHAVCHRVPARGGLAVRPSSGAGNVPQGPSTLPRHPPPAPRLTSRFTSSGHCLARPGFGGRGRLCPVVAPPLRRPRADCRCRQSRRRPCPGRQTPDLPYKQQHREGSAKYGTALTRWNR